MIHTSKSPSSLVRRLVQLALLCLASANLYAQEPGSLSLNGGSEVPPVTTQAIGTGEIAVRPDRTVSGSIKISGFVPTMAHIHEAATGHNGPPIVTLTRTSGDRFVVPPGTTLTEAQYNSYMAGNLYVNVHSAQYPGGEIRAQLPRTDTEGTPMD